MASIFLYDEANHKQPGDPQALTMDGAPRAIEEHYQHAVKQASWFTYSGMWRAAGTGTGKGILMAASLVVVGAALVGMIGAPANLLSIVDGGINAIADLPKNGPIVLSTLLVGATVGAIYDISSHRDAIQSELTKTRQMMRNLQGNEHDQQLGEERAHQHATIKEAILHDFDPMAEINNTAGKNQWQTRELERRAQANHNQIERFDR